MANIDIHILDVNPTGFCAGRLVTDGLRAEQSGEFLRKEHLVPALEQAMINKDRVRISFKDPSPSARPKILTSGIYLEEAFGGLVTYEGFEASFLKDHLEIFFDEDLQEFLDRTENNPWRYIAHAQKQDMATDVKTASAASPAKTVSAASEVSPKELAAQS